VQAQACLGQHPSSAGSNFDVSQPAISAYLKALCEAGLVTSERKGKTICYSVARDQVAWLAGRLGALAGRRGRSVWRER
jgi:DNA-binding transcriptional ArsR family regulator